MIDLKSFRRANKLTQAQVAEYLEVSAESPEGPYSIV